MGVRTVFLSFDPEWYLGAASIRHTERERERGRERPDEEGARAGRTEEDGVCVAMDWDVSFRSRGPHAVRSMLGQAKR